jgi:hypothetical protein
VIVVDRSCKHPGGLLKSRLLSTGLTAALGGLLLGSPILKGLFAAVVIAGESPLEAGLHPAGDRAPGTGPLHCTGLCIHGAAGPEGPPALSHL